MKKIKFLLVVAVIAIATFSCSQEKTHPNIILLIGDGMGVGAISASQLSMDNSPYSQFPVVGLVATCTADTLVTDSGAGVTAIVSGHRTNLKYLGNGPDGNKLKNIFEEVRPLGYKTGIITTSSVTDATPGGCVSHLNSRYLYYKIAEDFADSDFDLVIGGGTDKFLPIEKGGQRKDGIDLIEKIKSNNFEFIDSWEKLKAEQSTQKIFCLFEPDQLPKANKRDYTLGDLTNAALKNLRANNSQFALMVEGAQIDDVAHDTNAELWLSEMHDFNTAVNAALEFAKQDGNTLVVVTADHETGGVGILSGNIETRELDVQFLHNNHTANLIALFAYGPGSEKFAGVMRNDETGQKLFQLFDNSK